MSPRKKPTTRTKKPVNTDRFKVWLISQAARAKFAWAAFVVIAGIFGYKITVEETYSPVMDKVTTIERQIEDLKVELTKVANALNKNK